MNAIPLTRRRGEALDYMGYPLDPPAPPAPKWELPLVDVTRWIGAEPPERRWIVPGWLARGTGALLVGEDGVGKSLLAQQLVTTVSSSRPFMGLETVQTPALYVTCEDDEGELWRRQRNVNRALGLPADCAPAMLSSLVGYLDANLGTFDPEGRFHTSPAFDGIARLAKARGAGLIVLDNVAHLFTGNENVRRDVAAFCSALDRLAIDCDAAVVVLAHPNKAGAEYSGSTGWSAHVRQRWFLERPEGHDRDARVLRKSKANYSEAGTEIAFRWHEWAFVREDDFPDDRLAELRAVAANNADDAAFLACLAERTRQQRAVSDKSGRNLAPVVFEAMPEAKGIGKKRLEAAMDRLFRLGKIERAELWKGPDRKPVFGLRETAGNAAGNGAETRRGNSGEQGAGTAGNTHPPYYVREGGALGGPPPSPLESMARQRTRGSAEPFVAHNGGEGLDPEDVIWDDDDRRDRT